MGRKATTVALSTLPAGTHFTIPGSGRKGQLLRTPSVSSAYCRLWFTKEELEGRKTVFEDVPIATSTEVVPSAAPAVHRVVPTTNKE